MAIFIVIMGLLIAFIYTFETAAGSFSNLPPSRPPVLKPRKNFEGLVGGFYEPIAKWIERSCSHDNDLRYKTLQLILTRLSLTTCEREKDVAVVLRHLLFIPMKIPDPESIIARIIDIGKQKSNIRTNLAICVYYVIVRGGVNKLSQPLQLSLREFATNPVSEEEKSVIDSIFLRLSMVILDGPLQTKEFGDKHSYACYSTETNKRCKYFQGLPTVPVDCRCSHISASHGGFLLMPITPSWCPEKPLLD